MRLLRILLTLTLFTALPSARAQQVVPDSLDDSCSVSSDPRWTPQEKFVWERVCVGEDADFNATAGYGGNLDPTEPADWPQSRVLRPAFLRTILLNDPYRRALTRHGVSIIGARFTDAVDLENAELGHPLELQDSLLERGANLTRAKSKFPMGFQHSNAVSPFYLDELQLDADLLMGNGKFTDVSFIRARVSLLYLSGSKVAGKLDMSRLHVDQSLIMFEKAEFANVTLAGAYVSAVLNLGGAKVTGKLDMYGLHVGEYLAMSETEFADLVLQDAHVDGRLLLSTAKVTGKLHMNSLRVARSLDMSNSEFADAELIAAQVGGELIMSGSKVTGKLDCDRLEVGRQVFMDEGATFGDSINCRIAKIKGDLQLTGSRFEKNVDLSGAEIGGGLLLKSAQWSDGATLILRDAKVGIIPALADAWAPKLDLDGFTYRSAGTAEQFQGWFGRLDRYAPQPYDQLASIVQSQGDGRLATAIRYSGRERERSEAPGGAWAWLTALKWVIGYGYYPQRAIFWAIGLVMVGAIVLRVSGEGPRNGMPFGLAYSFDILLPIIKLRDRHYQIDLKTWARYYFYGHKIMGYVLASFLIAGLSGLTK